MIYLSTDTKQIDQVQQVAKRVKARLWPSAEQPVFTKKKEMPPHVSLLTDHFDNEKLVSLLSGAFENIVDLNATAGSIDAFLSDTKNELTHRLGVLLTCPVIYACDIGRLFAEALRNRLNFSVERFDGIHMALHEALVNGLTHGNLQLSSDLRQTARDFLEYSRLLSERLQDPAYASKSLSIVAYWNDEKLQIRLKDEGAGYSVQSGGTQMPACSAKSGRGLRLIAGMADSCTIEDFGREITLSFLLSENKEYHEAERTAAESPAVTNANLSAGRVLVVEDEPSNQTLLCRFLNIMGISMVDVAGDGIDALYKVAANKPDLIILDLTMPRMNGYEVLHHLKSVPQTRDIPVLIQTASDTRETRDQTFKLGATDFLIKPLNPLEFFARVRVHLENRLLVKKLEEQLAQIDKELESAEHMQIGLLPSAEKLTEIRQKYGLDIGHYFESSLKLGGDFWQLFPVSKTKLAVYVCDFSGHGVSAALNTFRLHATINAMERKFKKPSDFLKDLNRRLVQLLPRGQFATFFLGIIDIEKKQLRYSAAGSPRPVLLKGSKRQFLETKGMPLGIMASAEYDDYTVDFKKDNVLVMYSDALTESPNADGKRLGEQGFSDLMAPALKTKPAAAAVDNLMARFFDFTKPPLPDDATVVLIRKEK